AGGAGPPRASPRVRLPGGLPGLGRSVVRDRPGVPDRRRLLERLNLQLRKRTRGRALLGFLLRLAGATRDLAAADLHRDLKRLLVAGAMLGHPALPRHLPPPR